MWLSLPAARPVLTAACPARPAVRRGGCFNGPQAARPAALSGSPSLPGRVGPPRAASAAADPPPLHSPAASAAAAAAAALAATTPPDPKAIAAAVSAFASVAKAARRLEMPGRAALAADPSVARLASGLAAPGAAAVWGRGPVAVGALARAHADLGHGGVELGAVVFQAAAALADKGVAAVAAAPTTPAATEALIAATAPALALASAARAGPLSVRAAVLATAAGCLCGAVPGASSSSPLARAGRAPGPSAAGVRLAVEAAAAAASVLLGAGGVRSEAPPSSSSSSSEEDDGDGSGVLGGEEEAFWGGGAGELSGRAARSGAAAEAAAVSAASGPTHSDVAAARRLLTAALEAAATAADSGRLVPRAAARLGRALADSRALADRDADPPLFAAAVRAVRALARATVRGAAAAARARRSGNALSPEEAAPPGTVCDTAWALGRAVADLRGGPRGGGGRTASSGPPAADPAALASRAAADALAALGPALQEAAPAAPAPAVAAAAWALAATGRGGGGGGSAWPGSPASTTPPSVGAALDALGARAAALSATAPPRCTAQALWALSASRRAAPLAFEGAAHGLLPSCPGLGPAEAAVLGLAYARAGATASPACSALLDALADRALAGMAAGAGREAAWPRPAAPRAAANLCFALASAGRLPPALYTAACALAAAPGGAVGPVELGQLHVAGVALRAAGDAERAGGGGSTTAAPSTTPPSRPPAPAGDLFQTLLDAGRVARAAAACWGAGAPLGPATPSRSGSEMVGALAGLAAAADAAEEHAHSGSARRRDWTLAPEHRAAGLAAVDAAFPALRVAVEFDGPSHFFTNAPRPVGGTAFKRRLLAGAGWAVVSVPWGDWAQLGGEAARRAYLALALAGTGAALPPAVAAAVGEALGGGGGEAGGGARRGSRPPPPHNPALAASLAAELAAMRAAYAAGGGAGAHPGGGAGAAALLPPVGGEEAEAEAEPPPPALPARPPPDPALLATRLAAVQFRQGKVGLGGAAAAARRARKSEDEM